MSKKEKFAELSLDEQKAKREELSKKLREVRFASVMGKMENPMQKRHLRKSIARLNTFIHAQTKGERS